MFPYEDSETLFVCPYPEKRNHLSFVTISPTLVIDTSMERSSRVLQHGNTKNLIIKNSYLSVFAVMFSKQFLAYTVHIDRCYHSIHKHSSLSQIIPFIHIYVLKNFERLNLHSLRH